jgi:hemolysin III
MMHSYRCRRIREEIANSITHGAGLGFSLFAFVFLLLIALRRGEALGITSALLYGASLVALYLASTLYHATARPRRKHAMRLWDHCAIYLLIAGSYTPFLLLVLPPGIGWTLFGVVWMCAIAGILMKVLHTHRPTKLSTFSYLFLGWVSLIAIKPLYERLSSECFCLLVGGGVAYTVGTWFFLHDRRLFHHAVWHLFVLGGSICHFAAIVTVFLTAV